MGSREKEKAVRGVIVGWRIGGPTPSGAAASAKIGEISEI